MRDKQLLCYKMFYFYQQYLCGYESLVNASNGYCIHTILEVNHRNDYGDYPGRKLAL